MDLWGGEDIAIAGQEAILDIKVRAKTKTTQPRTLTLTPNLTRTPIGRETWLRRF